MKFDYVFFDIDGTMRSDSFDKNIFTEIKDILLQGDSKKFGIITNGHHERQLNFLKDNGVLDKINMDLFFSPTLFTEEALSDESHELRKNSVSLDFEDIRTEASKHKDYIFEKVKKKIGDSECILVDDSLISVVSAKRNGFSVVYLYDDSDIDIIKELNLDIDYFVDKKKLNELKKILF